MMTWTTYPPPTRRTGNMAVPSAWVMTDVVATNLLVLLSVTAAPMTGDLSALSMTRILRPPVACADATVTVSATAASEANSARTFIWMTPPRDQPGKAFARPGPNDERPNRVPEHPRPAHEDIVRARVYVAPTARFRQPRPPPPLQEIFSPRRTKRLPAPVKPRGDCSA